jgi:hypothetical protein
MKNRRDNSVLLGIRQDEKAIRQGFSRQIKKPAMFLAGRPVILLRIVLPRRGNGNKKRKFTSNIIMKIAKTSNTTSQIEIPIVFITDNNYVLPTGVAIKSLILNKKPKTLYRIYVIITGDVTAENKKKLIKSGRKKAPVELIDVDTGVLEEFRVPGYHVPPCDLLKFNIAGMLS